MKQHSCPATSNFPRPEHAIVYNSPAPAEKVLTQYLNLHPLKNDSHILIRIPKKLRDKYRKKVKNVSEDLREYIELRLAYESVESYFKDLMKYKKTEPSDLEIKNRTNRL